MLQDIRYGLRQLLKAPVVTLIAILTLGIGIGANTTIFSVADAFLVHPVPLPSTDRLAMVLQLRPGGDSDWNTVTPAAYQDWREQAKSFDAMAAMQGFSVNLSGDGDPEVLDTYRVEPDFFSLVNVQPALGRSFTAEEATPGKHREVILSYGFWKRRYAGDPQVLGRKIQLDAQPFTVVGVMPKGFEFPVEAQAWTPLALSSTERANRANHNLLIAARLKPNVSRAQAQAEMETIAKRLGDQFPQTDARWTVRVMTIAQWATGDITRSYTLMLLVAVGFVLLICCANVANVQFARGTARTREIAVRLALGASRLRIVRQMMIESLLLAAFGIVVAVLFASWALSLTLANMPPEVARLISGWSQIRFDARSFAFSVIAAVAAGIVSGVAPALRSTKVNIEAALKDASRGSSASRARHRLRSVFVVTQIALALVVLVGAGLMTKGVRSLIDINQRFQPDTLLTFDVSLPEAKYPKPEQRTQFFDEALAQLRAIPGVASAALSTSVPYQNGGDLSMSSIAVENVPPSPGHLQTSVIQTVSPNYLRQMHVDLKRGRMLADSDGPDQPPCIVVSEGFARRYFGDQDALGRRVRVGADNAQNPWMTIVGVVADVRNSWISAQPEATLYRSYRQTPRLYETITVRTEGDSAAVIAALRTAIARVDPDLPLRDVQLYRVMIHDSIIGLEYVAVMLAALSMIALALSAVGVYAVMAHSVAERAHEIGIRMALGASVSDIFRMSMGRGAAMMAIGLAIGLPIAIALARVMASVLFGVSAGDPLAFLTSTSVLAGIALIAIYVPARRATRVDPMVVLRNE